MSKLAECDFSQMLARACGAGCAGIPRQGRWHLLPRPWMDVRDELVSKNASLPLGGCKPTRCEFVYRAGRFPCARVFVKGAINDAEEGTINLAYWHQVLTSRQAR